MGGATRFMILLTSPRPPLLRFRLPRPSPCLLAATNFSTSTSSSSFSPRRRRLFHLLNSSSSSSSSSSVDSQQLHTQANTYPSSSPSSSSPWPEWSRLLERLSNTGYYNRPLHPDDQFVPTHLSQDFINSAAACLAFARDTPHLIRSLSTIDIERLVEHGSPFLFSNGPDSVRRMTSYLEEDHFTPLQSDQPSTTDLMRYLLSFASDFGASARTGSLYEKELLASSVRNLFSQVASKIYNTFQEQPTTGFPQSIEMKKGDWVCPGCSFMNFARNVKCLECERIRPKRQLTGGEWECPQCDFYNYNKNSACLRCDCKRPGEVSFNISNYQPGLRNVDQINKVEVDSRLAANDEKAEGWFTTVSQPGSSTGNSTIADNDFPEIIPLRKGVNRFVVSNRKTPLERRAADTRYQGTFDNEDNSQGKIGQTGATFSPSLDSILGSTSAADTEVKSFSTGQNAVTSEPTSRQPGYSRGSSSGYVPFVPLPADTFAKRPHSLKTEEKDNILIDYDESVVSESSKPVAPSPWTNHSTVSDESLRLSQKPNQVDNAEKEKEQAEKSERWFQRVTELHDVSDLAKEISDEDFPEIMPMRKGENRFVVNKKKDRSLTSPMYKRKMAMEQSSNTDFVPFVPFPADYFAKKDNQLSDNVVPPKATDVTYGQVASDEVPKKVIYSASTEYQHSTTKNWNSTSSAEKLTEKNDMVRWEVNNGYDTNNFVGPHMTKNNSDNTGNFRNADVSPRTTMFNQPENSNLRDSWRGKSLEGSAVKETDPLDMSEEAKAERWFRRAAQIKHISELSQIPDEDFPSIMPMRKGVNRFVVSKRKTPLERRLTSPQYRRNLPVVSSEPLKKENDCN